MSIEPYFKSHAGGEIKEKRPKQSFPHANSKKRDTILLFLPEHMPTEQKHFPSFPQEPTANNSKKGSFLHTRPRVTPFPLLFFTQQHLLLSLLFFFFFFLPPPLRGGESVLSSFLHFVIPRLRSMRSREGEKEERKNKKWEMTVTPADDTTLFPTLFQK